MKAPYFNKMRTLKRLGVVTKNGNARAGKTIMTARRRALRKRAWEQLRTMLRSTVAPRKNST